MAVQHIINVEKAMYHLFMQMDHTILKHLVKLDGLPLRNILKCSESVVFPQSDL